MTLRVLTRSLSALLFGVTIKLDDLDEPARRQIRAAQIDAVTQRVPLTMSVNILNAAIIICVFWGTGANVFLTVWGGLIASAAAAAFLSWNRTRRNRPKGASLRGIKRAIAHAAFLGGVWGAAPYALFPEADTMHQLFLAATMAGMISGGAFCLSMVPTAGLVYTWTIVFPSASALLTAAHSVFIYTAILLVIYALFISRNLVAYGRLFIDRLRDQLKIEAQHEVIGLLLNDFQENASDWLWETDANGVLMHVSDRFAEAAGRPPSEIQGALLSDVIGGQ
jgi:predicted signal transduction protein with EAL and GGDEF domain